MSTFVSVGNAKQPFTRLLEAVCKLAPQFPQPVFVQFGSAQVFDCPSCSGIAYIEMNEFNQQVGSAELLIFHAGAGSVINAIRAGKIPVLVPRRHEMGEIVDDHQIEFARNLEKTGKVIVAYDVDTLLQAAYSALERQRMADKTFIVEPPLVGMVRSSIAKADGRG
jgi:beta-1,4-N-acetylglucosaminyltransferase